MVAVTITRLEDGQQLSEETVELKHFSRQSVLNHAGIPEHMLMENDPEDEDAAVDMLVTEIGDRVYVSLLRNTDNINLMYNGLQKDWE